MPNPRLLAVLLVALAMPLPQAHAQSSRILAEGRLAAPVPSGDATQVYERRRIKRTVPMEEDKPLSATWDPLLETPDGPLQAIYCDWDDDFLYLAAAVAGPVEARFDIDGAADGWFRGADNLSIRITPPVAGSTTPLLEARRFDTIQNKERPVWAASPVPPSAIRSSWGRAAGGYAIRVAIPRTEVFGLKRKPGSEFAVRAEAGAGAASEGDAHATGLKPFLRVLLADSSEATAGLLTTRVSLLGGNQLVPGQPLRATLEVRNEARTPARLRRVLLGGSLGTSESVETIQVRDLTLKPGERWRRELKVALPAGLGAGSYVLRGHVEREDGGIVAALASFDRIEPYEVAINLDDKPVATSDSSAAARRRLAVVSIRSRADQKVTASVAIALPAGWSVESGQLARTLSLSFSSEVKGAGFKIVVPPDAPAGEYAIQATVVIGRLTYTAAGVLRIVGN